MDKNFLLEYVTAMALATRQPSPATQESSVLTKAVTRAAALLGLNQRQVAETLGLSGPTASRLFAGKYRLSPSRAKEWELAILFVRLFRSLDALWGHEGTARAWLEGYNAALGAAPLDLIKSAAGLVRVVDYLDHARGRV
jgi:transcriptional regulator with XRE-family HTH domain